MLEHNTKEKILLASLKLFALAGYEGVSFQNITDKLHITKGALYRHYKNKQEIFDSIIMRMNELNANMAIDFNISMVDLKTNNDEATNKAISFIK
ncbi:MAG: TetR/AcrR family transcriptional regulator [Bacilli bacterium]|jgi:AcrR family transcriptional regulator|nr:TetR/AcrR family transcriptional regulator [Bacilli bacterium]